MDINSVNKVTGFDPGQYDVTVQTVSSGIKNEDVLPNPAPGQSKSDKLSPALTPDLPTPTGSVSCLGAVPSFGSTYLALITEMSSEERRLNAEMRAQQTEELASKIEEDARTIRDKGVTQLITGIATGAVSIAQGLASASIMSRGISANEKTAQNAYDASISQSTDGGTRPLSGAAAMDAVLEKAGNASTLARQQADMMLNARVQAFNGMMGGSGSVLGSIGQYVATVFEAKLKESEADVERIRAQQQNLESLDENLKALIQKAISSQDALQQNINQTRAKILG